MANSLAVRSSRIYTTIGKTFAQGTPTAASINGLHHDKNSKYVYILVVTSFKMYNLCRLLMALLLSLKS